MCLTYVGFDCRVAIARHASLLPVLCTCISAWRCLWVCVCVCVCTKCVNAHRLSRTFIGPHVRLCTVCMSYVWRIQGGRVKSPPAFQLALYWHILARPWNAIKDNGTAGKNQHSKFKHSKYQAWRRAVYSTLPSRRHDQLFVGPVLSTELAID